MMRTRRCLAAAVSLAAVFALGASARADEAWFRSELAGEQVVPPVATAASGAVEAVLNTDTREITWLITYRGLSGPATAVRLHGPAPAGDNAEQAVGTIGNLSSPINGGSTLSPENAEHLLDGLLYLVIATAAFPDGELRGQLTVSEIEEGGGEE